MKKKTNSKANGKGFDLIALVLFAITSLYFLIEALAGKLLPIKYILIGAVVLLIIFGLLLLSVKFSKQGSWVRRILCLLLAGTMVFAGFYQTRIRNAFNGLADGSTNINAISLVVLNDSSIQSAEELSHARIGILNSADTSLNQAAISTINDETITYIETSDVMVLANELVSQTVDAVLLPQAQLGILEKNNEDLFNRLRVLATYEEHVENTEIASDKDITKEPFTVYISGLDSLGVPNYNGLSDVNMLLMVDPITHHIEMVSIPRDAYVPNQAYANYPDKLTHLGNDGIDNVVQSMENVFGFDIDYYAKVSFSSLIEIINTLGGIEVDVQLEFYEQDENRDYSNQIHLYPGLQTLDGRSALAYARHRHTEGWGDLGRNYAQQQIIEAIINKVLTAEGIAKVPDVLQVGAEYVSTNMPIDEVKRFINNEIDHPRSWTFSSTSLAGGLNEQQLCVSATSYGALFVYILDRNELNTVYADYMQMFEPQTLADFKFTLDDLSKYEVQMPENQYLLTADNYLNKLSTMFPSLQYTPAPAPSEDVVPDVETQPETSTPSDSLPEDNENGEVSDPSQPDNNEGIDEPLPEPTPSVPEDEQPQENNGPEEMLPQDPNSDLNGSDLPFDEQNVGI